MSSGMSINMGFMVSGCTTKNYLYNSFVCDNVYLKLAIEQGYEWNFAMVEIVNDRQNCFKRVDYSNLYSFRNLRMVLTEELELVDVKPNWGFTVKHDWITEDERELAELKNE